MQHVAFKYQAKVGPEGKVEVNVPVAPGTNVEVLVISAEKDEFGDLVAAAGSNLEFWDNPWDDEDWNNA